MTDRLKIKTLGQLKRSGYGTVSVREEIRRNLISKIRNKEDLFPGIVGFEDTVVPQVENAILSGQDIIFLGERGQAKSRLIRALVNLLDEALPVVQGCEINDNPFDPICRSCHNRLENDGDKLPVTWIGRDERYAEKLATPDISIADLIGEVDPIRVAEGRYLSDELTIHYGLIPRVNRGIFSINELPDLAERIQVGLFNLIEERDIQIKGHRVRLPLDLLIVASANPEDYTNRGRIITPLKDRYGAQIRTHYPQSTEHEISIMEAERNHFQDTEKSILVSQYMREIVAEFTALARQSPDINQRSGVSVRVSIANYESVISNALRRSIRCKEKLIVPRVSDLSSILASTSGKVELESIEEGQEERIIGDLTKKAILNIFNNHLGDHDFDLLIQQFEEGLVVEIGNDIPSKEYTKLLNKLGGISDTFETLGVSGEPPEVAATVEFIMEGLHLSRRLNRDVVGGRYRYSG
jgi:magnesium chelatase subunit I